MCMQVQGACMMRACQLKVCMQGMLPIHVHVPTHVHEVASMLAACMMGACKDDNCIRSIIDSVDMDSVSSGEG